MHLHHTYDKHSFCKEYGDTNRSLFLCIINNANLLLCGVLIELALSAEFTLLLLGVAASIQAAKLTCEKLLLVTSKQATGSLHILIVRVAVGKQVIITSRLVVATINKQAIAVIVDKQVVVIVSILVIVITDKQVIKLVVTVVILAITGIQATNIK